MYQWRKLTEEQREQAMARRMAMGRPWHSPPRFDSSDVRDYHLSAACYEHQPHIGLTLERLDEFARTLLQSLPEADMKVHAWCVLPNHYHLLLQTGDLHGIVAMLGRLHGRCSHQWNGQEHQRGRKVFHSTADRAIRSEGHFWATINYIHHNPVRHGWASTWAQWPWSSATDYLAAVGRDEAARRWKAYPILNYGRDWDV